MIDGHLRDEVGSGSRAAAAAVVRRGATPPGVFLPVRSHRKTFAKGLLTGLTIAAVGAVVVSTALHPEAVASHPLPAEVSLARRLPEVNIGPVPFDKGIEEFSRLSGLPITVDWPALEQGGWIRNRPVAVQLRDTSVREALDVLLATAAPWPGEIAYMVDGPNSLRLTNSDSVYAASVPRLYDLRDLINRDLAWYESLYPEADEAARKAAMPSRWDDNRSRARRILEQYSDLIPQAVGNFTWEQDGSKPRVSTPQIWQVPGGLVILQTHQNHRRINQCLAELRRGAIAGSPPPPPTRPPADAGRPGAVAPRDDSEVKPRRTPETYDVHRRVGDLDLTGRTLDQALDRLRDVAGHDVVVRWGALKEAKVGPGTRVNIRLWDVTAAQALSAVLDSVEPPWADLLWEQDPDTYALVVTTRDDWYRAYPQLYDIRGLVASILTQRRPPGTEPGDEQTEEAVEDAAQTVHDLVDDLTNDTKWLGDDPLNLTNHVIGPWLVITATHSGHQKMQRFLDQLTAEYSGRRSIRPATKPVAEESPQ